MSKLCKENFYGFEVDHPSQRKHVCLMMVDEVKWPWFVAIHTAEAVKQVNRKRCIWSGFLEATRVLKWFFMRTSMIRSS